MQLGQDTPAFVEMLTAPAAKILDKYFESDILKATLATDAIIGAQVRLDITRTRLIAIVSA